MDKPLKSYVPDHAPADARGDRITARHVLSHSSGLRNALAPATRDLMLTSHTPINAALSWGLGLGQELHGGQRYAWHRGDNGNWKNFVLVHPAIRSALAVFTNGSRSLNIANRIVAAASDGEHEAFLWL